MFHPSRLEPTPPTPLNLIIYKAQVITKNFHRTLGSAGVCLSSHLSSRVMILDMQGHISGMEGVAEATKTKKALPSFAGHQATLTIETQRRLRIAGNIMGYQAQFTNDSGKTPL